MPDLVSLDVIKAAADRIRGVAKLTGFNPANIKNMLQHKRAIVKKMLITLEKLAEEY